MTKRMKLLAAVLGCAVFAVWTISAPAQSEKEDKSAAQEQKEGAPEGFSPEQMAELIKSGTPGEHHQHLKAFEGKWKQEVKHRMSPDAPWTESEGSATYTWVLDGRFLRQEINSTMGDMPFQGLGYLGYDNTKKKYVNTWMDSMSTGIIYSEGTCDPSGKIFTLKGEFDCCITKQKKTFKWVSTVEGDDKNVFQWYEKDDSGKEFVSMEMVSTRM